RRRRSHCDDSGTRLHGTDSRREGFGSPVTRSVSPSPTTERQTTARRRPKSTPRRHRRRRADRWWPPRASVRNARSPARRTGHVLPTVRIRCRLSPGVTSFPSLSPRTTDGSQGGVMCGTGHSHDHEHGQFGFLVDTPEIRALIGETERLMSSSDAPATRVEAFKPAFAKLLSSANWLPDRLAQPEKKSRMGDGIGQYAVDLAENGSL